MRLSEDFTVLATFDPGTFLLRFNIDLGLDLTDENRYRFSAQDLIRKTPVSTASHEFSHFVQGCATASGVREFFFAIDLAQFGFFALQAATECGKSTLTAPIVKNKGLYSSSERFKELLARYLVVARTLLLHIGGQLTRRHAVKHDADQGWLKVEPDVSVFNARVAAPLFFADMKRISNDPVLVLLGSIHLSEAFAKAIEMVQRHLTGEPGMRADPGFGLRGVNLRDFPLANPYFIVHWIYGNFIRTLPQEAQERSCVEELCAIIDLSLMVDPVVTASTLKRQGEFGAFWAKHRLDYTPMHAFMMFLAVLVDSHRELPRLDFRWRQEHVTRFQNALLKKAGFSVSVLELTQATIEYVEQGFKLVNENDLFISPSLAAEYYGTFKSLLHWRAETLNGGAVLEDFLTGADTLYDFVLSVVPAFALGPLIVSTRADVRPGEGVGVDIGNLYQYRSIVQALISGNTPCSLHTGNPRGCAAPPHDYCHALPADLSGLRRCTRETSLDDLLRSLRVSRLIWKS